MLLLQEFDIEINDKKGSENIVTDHLSRLELEQDGDEEDKPIQELFSDEMLIAIKSLKAPWFADIANFISSGKLPKEFNSQQMKKLIYDSKYYLWNKLYLWKLCSDRMIKRCVEEEQTGSIFMISGGHFVPQRTDAKVLEG